MKSFLKKLSLKQKVIITLVIAAILDIADIVLGKLGILVLFRGNFFALRLYAMIFVTYKFINILTNENKYISKFGTFFICCSSAVLARINFDLVTLGELFVIFLNKYFDYKTIAKDEALVKKSTKICIVGMIVSIVSYILSSDFSLQFSLIYIFIALSIWSILKQDKKYWKKSFIVGGIGLVIVYCIYFLIGKYTNLYAINMSNDVTPNVGFFSYAYSFMIPYTNFANKVSYYSLLHLFPLPLIMAGIFSFKNDNSKDDSFFLPMMAVTVFEIMMTVYFVPDIFKVLTGIKYAQMIDISFAIGLLNIYTLYYIWSNVSEKLFEKDIHSIWIILVIIVVLYYMIDLPLSIGYKRLFIAAVTALDYLSITTYKDKYLKATMWLFTLLTIWGIPALFL